MERSRYEVQIERKRKQAQVQEGQEKGWEQDQLFSQYVNSVKFNAISCDYIRQLFQEKICTQLLSQM